MLMQIFFARMRALLEARRKSEQHLAWFSASAPAICEVKGAVGLRHVVPFGVPEQASGTIDACHGALEFNESPDRGLIEFDFESVDGWENVGRSKLFITEHWTQSEGAQDALQAAGSVEGYLRLVSDLEVSPGVRSPVSGFGLSRGAGRPFVRQNRCDVIADSFWAAPRRGLLDSNADELAAPPQISVRRVIQCV